MPSVVNQVRSNVQRVLSEDLLTLNEARDELSVILRKRPDKSTLVRWITIGVGPGQGKVRLEAARIGCQWMTSRQAITRFIEARTAQ
ncbi:DUF1580 domain-containing protein [Crateriforma spongiae]|uniref:DUF1580 domain-containing protein n=1 Tax=Crateriforma spongiae TaxID=2724528 RepID=UPI0014488474